MPLPLGAMALHLAARKHVGVVEALLAAGADPNAAGSDGSTPLMIACEAGATAAVCALLMGGATPHALREDGATALEVAEENGHVALAAQLGLLLLSQASRRGGFWV